MGRNVSRRWLSVMHKLHRWLGSAWALLMAMWFASGAVMTFADYPAYTDAERLGHAAPLTAAEVAVPPALSQWLREGGLARAGQLRLMMLEDEPRWLLTSDERYQAWRAQAPWEVSPLDAARAVSEARRTHGACSGSAAILAEPDQWTVGRSQPGSYPLQRLACDDGRGLELYVSTRSGEVVQQSTRSERALAWLGPIPHWIYPAALRRERALWRDVVLWLAGIGWLVTVTGMVAGVHAALRGVSRAGVAAGAGERRSHQRQVYLRWHQRLGLGFGVFASSWVFSGALSLEPLHWASSESEAALAAKWSQAAIHPDLLWSLDAQLTAALGSCREQLPELRELELVALGQLYAVCSDVHANTRIVDLADPELTARRRIADAELQQLAAAGAGDQQPARLALSEQADDYYYPTHRQPIARPYARFALPDAAHSVLYVDPARGQLLLQMDDKKRLERWLYHGLHSWDFPVLYAQRGLWRGVIIAAMAVGCALALLGLSIFLRRQRRLRAHRARVAGQRAARRS